MEIFRKNVGDFLGTFGGSPRGRLGFAEGKARRTSVFLRIRAPEGPEGSPKINKQSVLFYCFGKLRMRTQTMYKKLEILRIEAT